MKKAVFPFIILIFSVACCRGQCNKKNLFPVAMGITKYSAINQLNLQKNIEYDPGNTYHYSFDSVSFSILHCQFLQNKCIIKGRNKLVISFANDTLYEIKIKVWFAKKDFDDCLTIYNSVISELKPEYPAGQEFSTVSGKSNNQIGQGYTLYKSKEQSPREHIQIGYMMCEDLSGDYELEIIYLKFPEARPHLRHLTQE